MVGQGPEVYNARGRRIHQLLANHTMQPPRNRLIGESPAFLKVLEDTSRLAALDRPALIVGERGTGKELIAERLHFLSERWERPYERLNCAAISESLLESELFGHESGAFTGASRQHRGRFERADGGSLFLDELATMPVRVQEQILRIIEYGSFERLGGSRTLEIDVRLIAATNVDLPSAARSRTFRSDPLDRLAFDVITLPPLRARTEDIPLLADHFAINMSTTLGHDLFAGFSERAREQLLAWHWPGNVRELKNVVERAVYRSDPGEPVDRIDFDPFESPWRPRGEPEPARNHAAPDAGATCDGEPLAPADGTHSIDDSAAHALALPMDLRTHLREHEIGILRAALAASRYNQRRTAESLGLTYHALRGLLRKYDLLDAGPERPSA